MKEAASKGKIEICEYLLEMGADINIKSKNGSTPFLTACQKGHLTTAQRLHELGANIDLTTEEGKNCLHVASEFGHIAICEWLVEQIKFDINQATVANDTALDLAVQKD